MLTRLYAESFNCIAYVTTRRGVPPRTNGTVLTGFLHSVLHEDTKYESFQIFEGNLRESLHASAREASSHADRFLSDADVVFRQHQTAEILQPIHQLFSKTEVPAFLAIVGGDLRKEGALVRSLSNSGMMCFWLENTAEVLEVIDPLLPVRMLCDVAIPYPQCVFWSKHGAACLLPVDLAKDLCNLLLEAKSDSETADKIISSYRRPRMRATTILHLSDLHYGKLEPVQHEMYLLGHLENVLQQVDRVVITGDLCHGPSQVNLAAFNNFRRQIETMSKEVIVIPGNHDQRKGGTALWRFGRSLGVLAELEWSRLIVDHNLRVVFFCFDSSLCGNMARGRIEDDDLLSMSINFQIKVQAESEIATYFKIALVHHHPFSFDGNRNRLQALWSKLMLDDDMYLRLERAEEFVAWCQNMGVQSILHGHKHIPKWFIRQGVNPISAIGCGSTAGVDSDYLSYVIVAADSRSKRHSAAFYRGAKNGSGFVPEAMTATFI